MATNSKELIVDKKKQVSLLTTRIRTHLVVIHQLSLQLNGIEYMYNYIENIESFISIFYHEYCLFPKIIYRKGNLNRAIS